MASIIVRSEEGYRTAIQIRNHTVMADEQIQDGGTDTAPTPMEILQGTIGACVAVTTRAYAQRKGWALEGVEVEVELERVKPEDYPDYTGDAPFVHVVTERIRFEGALSEEQIARLHEIAKKCPVHRTLENPVFFTEAPVTEGSPVAE